MKLQLIIISVLFHLCLCMSAFAAGGEPPPDPAVKISMLDIGQGDAILISELGSGRNIMVDLGTPLAGRKLIQTFREGSISKLDAVILTHPHPDHFGGLFAVSPDYTPLRFFDNGQDLGPVKKDQTFYGYYEKLVRKGNYSPLKEGDTLQQGEIVIKVLSSAGSLSTSDWNTNSLVFMLSYKTFKMLFMGDANRSTESYLEEKYCNELKAQVLKAGHHGASDTGDEKFLRCVQPENVLISVEDGNSLGSPDKQTVKRYKKHAGRVFITSLDGDIEIKITKQGAFQIEASRDT